jgi:hypothetical protein
MNFVDFTAGNKEYKLRLNTRNIIALEKSLGGNPLSVFGKGDRIPTITEMVTILHAALQQMQHGITLNDANDIFDAYLEEHTMTEFLPVILEVYRASGIIGEEGKN